MFPSAKHSLQGLKVGRYFAPTAAKPAAQFCSRRSRIRGVVGDYVRRMDPRTAMEKQGFKKCESVD